jgi:hypothetical protein
MTTTTPETQTMTETKPETCAEFVNQGWSDHEADSEGVLARLPAGVALAGTGQDVASLAALIVHVAAEHLGRPAVGLELLDLLVASPAHAAGGPAAKAVLRSRAVLQRVAGDVEASHESLAAAHAGSELPEASTRARVLAVVSSALAGQGRLPEASAAFAEAVELVAYGPGAEDPAARALAITGNNLACALEEAPDRTAAADALLETAAHTARRYWEVAGNWVNVKIAEYRLAMTHVALGRPGDAVAHAKLALALVDANEGSDGDRFFPYEALARAHHAGGDAAAAAEAREAAAKALEGAEEANREWFAGALEALDATLAG